MLEEQLTILRGLWTEPDGWSFEGRHYAVQDALFRAKPVQRRTRRSSPAAMAPLARCG